MSTSVSSGVTIDLNALGRVDAMLTVPVESESLASYFNHEFVSHVAHSQLYLEQEFKHLEAGHEDVITGPRFFDELHKQYLRISLAGIIGEHTVGHTTAYPTAGAGAACDGVDNAAGECIPADDQLMDSFGSGSATSYAATLGANPWAHYVYGVGFRAIEELCYEPGEVLTDKLDYDYLYANEELTGAAGKRQSYQVGKYATRAELIRASLFDQDLYMAVPLWYTHFIGNSKHVEMMQLTTVNYRLKLAALKDLIIVATSSTQVNASTVADDNAVVTANVTNVPAVTANTVLKYTADHTNAAGVAADEVVSANLTSYSSATSTVAAVFGRKDSGTAVTSKAVKATMVYQVFYLEDSERDRKARFSRNATAQSAHEVLITTVTKNTYQKPTGVTEVTFRLRGSNALYELLIVPQMKLNRTGNKWFNYSRTLGTAGTGAAALTDKNLVRPTIVDRDIIKTIGVSQNTQERMKTLKAQHYRIVTPQVSHSSMPDREANALVYSVPWAAFPEDTTKGSGSVSLSRVEDVEVELVFDPEVAAQEVSVSFYLKTWNIWKYFSNIGGPSA